MRPPVSLAMIALLALSACNKAPENGAADPAAGAKALAAADNFQMQPGLYRTTIDLKQINVPDLPPQVLAMLKQRMVEQPITYCITPADAAKGLEAMKERLGKGKCQFDSFNAAGGKLDANFTCDMGGKGSMKVASHGSYTDTGSVTTASVDMAMAGVNKMHLEQVNTTTRIGDCTK